MTTFLLRASHANEYELQNYYPLAAKRDLRVVTSRHTLTPVALPTIPLWSPTDLPPFPFRRQVLNRLIGGEQWLVGLEKIVHKNDIIHTAETYTPYTHQAVLLRKTGKIKKLISTCSETIPGNNEKFGRLRNWKKQAYRYVNLFHTLTELGKQALVTEGVNPQKIVVIPYGVDLERFHPPKEPRLTRVKPLVLTVTRLVPEKGVEDLDIVAKKLPQLDFLVIGQGSYRFSAPNVKTRVATYQEMPAIYQSADYFLHPARATATWEEQFGMALVEAMACGLPIVTTATGAIPEVVGHAALLAPPASPPRIVKSFLQLLAHQSIGRQLSVLALARAHTLYDSVQVARRLASLY